MSSYEDAEAAIPLSPARRLGVAVVLLGLGLSMMALPCRMPTPNADPSYQLVLNYAAEHHLQYGVDLVFTYGPLGHLMQNVYYPGTWLSVLLFQLVSRALFLLVIGGLAGLRLEEWRPKTLFRKRPDLLVFAGAALLAPAMDYDAFYLLFITFTGAWLCREAKTGWGHFVLLGTVAAMGLIKVTFLLLGGVMLAVVLFWCLSRGRRVLAAQMAGVYLLSFAGAWGGLGHQRFANLPTWLRNAGEITRSYQLGMGLFATPLAFACGFAVGLVLVSGLVLALKRSGHNLPLVLLLACGTVLAWKQGFTRGAPDHTRTFFAYALTVTAALPVLLGSGFRWAVPLVVLGLSLAGGLLVRLPAPAARAFENARFLARLPRMHTLYERHAQTFALPSIRSRVGTATLDVGATEQAIAMLNGFNYHPCPVFQPYAGCTAKLIQLNADFYRSDRAPEFILTKRYTIDERLPNLDDSLSGLIIAQRYRRVASEADYDLLQRVADHCGVTETLASGSAAVGDSLKLSGAQWRELSLDSTRFGRLLSTGWMSPPMFVELRHADGTVASYRFVPSMASSGFVVPEGTVSLTLSNTPSARLCFAPIFHYRLARIAQPAQ